MPPPLFQLELATGLHLAPRSFDSDSSQHGATPGTEAVIRLVDSNSPLVQSFLNLHREALATDFQRTLRASTRLFSRVSTGEYGPINGIGIELHHKRGLLITPVQYALTVFVPAKLPRSQLRKRRASRQKTGTPKTQVPKSGTVESMPNHQPVILPRMFEKIPVKVMEGQAAPATPQQAYGTHADQRDLGSQFAAISHSRDGMQAIGGSVISRHRLDNSSEFVGGSSMESGPSDWGTLGIVVADSAGQKLGFTCAHVVDSGAAYSLDASPDTDRESGSQDRPYYTSVRQRSASLIGEVLRSSHSPKQGVDASVFKLGSEHFEGIFDLEKEFRELRFLVRSPARKSRWSWLIQRPVLLRGARTGRVVHGRVAMPTVHSIEIGGKRFQDLMVVQSASASSAIVAPGDSGTAVLVNWESQWYWVGIVIAMLSPQQAVVSKLPACMEACSLKSSRFPKNRLGELR